MMVYLYASLGLLCVGLALLGVFLPLLPTVPFLLLAAFFFARSSQRLHDWLLRHRRFGPMIEDWNRSGAISLPAKRWATVSIGLVFGISLALGVPGFVLGIQAIALGAVLAFLWTRPSSG